MYVGDYLARRCVYGADAVAVVDVTGEAPRRLTYGEMNRNAGIPPCLILLPLTPGNLMTCTG